MYWYPHVNFIYSYLIKHCLKLIQKGSRIFIPLCGKTVDIKWLEFVYERRSRQFLFDSFTVFVFIRLYDNGFIVHGLEYEESAIIEFFKDFHLSYKKIKLSDDITVFKVNSHCIVIPQCMHNWLIFFQLHRPPWLQNMYFIFRLTIPKFNYFKAISLNSMSIKFLIQRSFCP